MQSGYMKVLGTEFATAKVLGDILKTSDEGKICAVVLLDFSKGFDLVNCQLLSASFLYF